MEQYTKYHRQFKKISNRERDFFEDSSLIKWGKYLSSRITNESPFHLYYYTWFEKKEKEVIHPSIEELYISSRKTMNDFFEGVGKTDEEGITEIIADTNHYAYIKCFSEAYNHNLMWSYYGNNNGICIEYDFSLIPEDNYIWSFLFPVIYVKSREKQIAYNELNESLNKGKLDWLYDSKGVFTQKSNLWKHEKEWRIVLLKNDIEIHRDEFVEICDDHVIAPFDYVNSVFIGPGLIKRQDEVIQYIQNTKKSHRKYNVLQMEVQSNSSFELLAVPIAKV